MRRLIAGLGAALLLPLGACSSDDDITYPPNPATSRSTEPPAPSRATLPPEARGSGRVAAKAFVTFYFEVISEAMSTGRTKRILKFGTPTCGSCASVAAMVDKFHAGDGSMETRGWEPTAFTGNELVPGGRSFELRVTQHPRALRQGRKVVGSTPMATFAMRVEVHRTGDRWRTARLELLR